MKTCKHCGNQFYESHYCESADRKIDHDDDSNFLLNVVEGAILGEVVSDMFSDSSPSMPDTSSGDFTGGGGDFGGGGASGDF